MKCCCGNNHAKYKMLHLSQMLKELGYNTTPIVFQDNKSTIELINRGRPTSNSRHIDIKYFFVSDIQQRKLVQINYCSSIEMIGDILTKPIQGQQFIYLRNLLLGHPKQTIEGSVVNYDCSSHLTTGAAADQQQAATDRHSSSHACNRLSVCPAFS